ncbi:ATP-binding cassette sub-family A member 13 isoform X2 [Polypterus senegalus]|uniref:ATP-binding cassette sub-family A member 13 isoform X2 n=1 Tax=Polypterus senegalus TaxID=55291 RepID=UPI001962DFC2|nr:ATP-binding cassette sub-family A member 13 isoform X2 [Polypterus senegalus]
MASFLRQLRLLLWKNFVGVLRQPVWSLAVILWPLIIFLILAITRTKFQPVKINTCFVAPRNLPSAGFLPFLQTLLCSTDSSCRGYSYTTPNKSFEIRSMNLNDEYSSRSAPTSPDGSQVGGLDILSRAFTQGGSNQLISQLGNIQSAWNTSDFNRLTSVIDVLTNVSITLEQQTTSGNLTLVDFLKSVVCNLTVPYIKASSNNSLSPLASTYVNFCHLNGTFPDALLAAVNEALGLSPTSLLTAVISIVGKIKTIQNETSLWSLLYEAPQLFQLGPQKQNLQDVLQFLQNAEGELQSIQSDFSLAGNPVMAVLRQTIAQGISVLNYTLNWPGRGININVKDVLNSSTGINGTLLENLTVPLDKALLLVNFEQLNSSFCAGVNRSQPDSAAHFGSLCQNNGLQWLFDRIDRNKVAEQIVLLWIRDVSPSDVSFTFQILNNLLGLISINNTNITNVLSRSMNVFNAWLPAIGDSLLLPTKQTTAGEWLMSLLNAVLVTTDGTPGSMMVKGVMKAIMDLLTKLLDVQTGILTYVETAAVNLQSTIFLLVNNDTFFDNWIGKRINRTIDVLQTFQTNGSCIHYTSPLADTFSEILPLGGGWSQLLCSNMTFLDSVLQTVVNPVMDQVMSLKNILNKASIQDLTDSAVLSSSEALNTSSVNFMAAVNGVIQSLGMGYWRAWATDSTAKTANCTERMLTLADLLGSKLQEQEQWPQMRTFFDALYWIMNGLQTRNSGPPMCVFTNSTAFLTCNVTYSWRQFTTLALTILQTSPKNPDSLLWVLQDGLSFIKAAYITQLKQNMTQAVAQNLALQSLLDSVLKLVEANTNLVSSMTSFNQFDSGVAGTVLKSLLESFNLTPLESLWNGGGLNVSNFINIMSQVMTNNQQFITRVPGINETKFLVTQLDPLIEQWLASNFSSSLSFTIGQQLLSLIMSLNQSDPTVLNQVLQPLIPTGLNIPNAIQLALQTIQQFIQVIQGPDDTLNILSGYLNQIQNFLISQGGLDVLLQALNPYWQSNDTIALIHQYGLQEVALGELPFLFTSYVKNASSFQTPESVLKRFIGHLPQDQQAELEQAFNSTDKLLAAVSLCRTNNFSCIPAFSEITNVLLMVGQVLHASNGSGSAVFWNNSTFALGLREISNLASTSDVLSTILSWGNLTAGPVPASMLYETVVQAFDFLKEVGNTSNITSSVCQQLLEKSHLNLTRVNGVLHALTSRNVTNLFNKLDAIVGIQDCQPNKSLPCTLEIATNLMGALRETNLNDVIERKISAAEIILQYWIAILNESTTMMKPLEAIYDSTVHALQDGSVPKVIGNAVTLISDSLIRIKSNMRQLGNMSSPQLDASIQVLDELVQRFLNGTNENGTTSQGMLADYDTGKVPRCLQITEWYVQMLENLTLRGIPAGSLYPFFRISQMALASALSNAGLSADLASAINASRGYLQGVQPPFDTAGLVNVTQFLVRDIILEAQPYLEQIQNFIQSVEPASSSFLSPLFQGSLSQTQKELLDSFTALLVPLGTASNLDSFREVEAFLQAAHQNVTAPLFGLFSADNVTAQVVFSLMDSWSRVPLEGSFTKEEFETFYTYYVEFYQLIESDRWNMSDLEPKLSEFLYQWSVVLLNSSTNSSWVGTNCSALHFIQCMIDNTVTGHTQNAILAASGCVSNGTNLIMTAKYEALAYGFLNLSYEMNQKYKNDSLGIVQDALPCIVTMLSLSTGVLAKLSDAPGMQNTWMEELHVKMKQDLEQMPHFAFCKDLDNRSVLVFEHIMSVPPDQFNVFLHLLQNQSLFSSSLSSVMPPLNMLISRMDSSELLDQLKAILIAMTTSEGDPFSQLQHLLLSSTLDAAFNGSQEGFQILEQIFMLPWNGTSMKNRMALFQSFVDILQQENGTLALQSLTAVQSFLNEVNSSGLLQFLSSWGDSQNQRNNGTSLLNIIAVLQNITQAWLGENQFEALLLESLQSNRSEANALTQMEVLNSLAGFLWPLLPADMQPYDNITMEVLEMLWPVMADISRGDSPNFYTMADLLLNLTRTITENFAGVTHETMFSDLLDVLEVIVQLASSSLDRNISRVESLTNKMFHHFEVLVNATLPEDVASTMVQVLESARIYSEVLTEFNPMENWTQQLQWIFSFLLPNSNSSSYDFTSVMSLLNQSGGNYSSFEGNVKLLRILLDLLPENNTAGAALSLMQNVTKYLTTGNQGNASPAVDAYYLLKLILEHGDILQNESVTEMLLDNGLSPWSGVPLDVHARLQWMITDAVKMLITEKCPWLKEYNITNEYVNSWVSASFSQANGSASSDPWETLLHRVWSFISQSVSIFHPSTGGQLLSSEAQLLLNASFNLLTQGSMNTSQLWKERLDLFLQNLLGNTSDSSMDQVGAGDVYKLVDGALIEQVMQAAATELLGLNIIGSSSPMYGLLSWFIDTNDTTLVLMRAMEFVTWWNSVKDTDMEFVVQAVQKAYNLVNAVLLTLPQVDFTLSPYVLSHRDTALSALDTLVNFTELNNSTGVTFIASLATVLKNYIDNDPTLQTVLPMAQQMLNISRLWHGDSGSFIQLLSSLSSVLTESSVNLTNNSIPLLFTDLVTTFSQPEKTSQILSTLKAVEDCQMNPENCSLIISQIYQFVLLMYNTSQNGTAWPNTSLDALNSIPSQEAHLLSYVNLTESLIFAVLPSLNPQQDPAPQVKFLSKIFAAIRNFLIDPSSSANEIAVTINFTMSINEFSETLPPLEQLRAFTRSIESALRQEQCNVSDPSDLAQCIYETCKRVQEILQLFNATTNSGEIIDVIEPMVEFWITKMTKNETAVSGELQEAVNFTMKVFQNQFSINNLLNNIVSSLQQVKDDLVRWNVTSNQTAETLQLVEGLLQLLEKDSGYLVPAFNRSALQSAEVEVLITKLSLLETEFMLLKEVSSLFEGSTTHNQYSTIVDFITASLLLDKQLPLSVISPLTSLLNLSKNLMVSGNVTNSFDLSAFVLESIISSLNLPVLQNQTLTEENFLFVLSFLNFIQSDLKVNASTLILQVLSNDIEPLWALNELVALFGSLPSENQLGLIANVFHMNAGTLLSSLSSLKDEIGLILGLHASGNLDMESILNFFNSSMKIVENELSIANISGNEAVVKSLSDLLYFFSHFTSIYQFPGGAINSCSITAMWQDLFEIVNITLPSGYLQTCQGFEDLATSIINLYNKILQMTQSAGGMTDVFLAAVSVADQFVTLVQAESNLLQTDIPVIPVLHQVFADIINSVQTSNSTSSVDASVLSPITPDEQGILLSAITTLNTLLQMYTNTSTATSPYVEVSSIVEDLLMSRPASLSPYINALDKIVASFSLLLTEQQMSSIYPSDQMIKVLIAFLNSSDSPANLATITNMTADSFHSLLGFLENFTLPNGLKIMDVNQLIGNISMALADSIPMVLNTSGPSNPNDQKINDLLNHLINNFTMVLTDSLPMLLNTLGLVGPNDQKINNALNQLVNNITMVVVGSLPQLLNTNGPSGPNDQKINDLLNQIINNITVVLADSLPMVTNTSRLFDPNAIQLSAMLRSFIQNKLPSNLALLNFSGTIQELDNLISAVVALVGTEQSHYLNVTYEIVRNLVLSVYTSKNSVTAADILNAMSGSFARLLGVIPNKMTPQAVSTRFNDTVVFVRNLQDLLNKTRLIKAVKVTALVVGELQNVLEIFSPSYALKSTSNVLQMLKSNLESAPLSNSSDWISETFQILTSVIKLIPFQNSSTSLLTNVTLSLANATQDKVLWESLGTDLTKLFTESGNGSASAKLKEKVAVTQDLRSVVCRIEQLTSVQQLYQLASFTPGLVCQTFLPAIVSLLSLSERLTSNWMDSPPNSDAVQAYFLSGINNFELQLNWFNGILNTTQSINWTSLANFVNESNSTTATTVLLDIITRPKVFKSELHNMSGISGDVINNITSVSLPQNITQALPWIRNLISQEGAQMNATQWYYLTVALLRYMDFSKLFLKLMLPTELQRYIDIIIQLLLRLLGIFENSQPLIASLQTFITEIQQLSATSLASQQRDMFASSRAASFPSFSSISAALCSNGVISLFAMPNIAESVGSQPSTQSNMSTEQLLQKFDIPNDTTPFCKNVFLNMVSTTSGAVMWAFLKPMLLGKILFTPDIPETWAIMQKSNVTLQDLYQLTTYADMWIGNSSNIQTLVTVLTQIKPLLIFLKNPNVQSFISLETNINITDVVQNAEKLSNFSAILSANMALLNQMTTLCKLLKNISSCVNFDRYQAMNTTDALNSEATKLLQHNNIYASVIFNITPQKSRQKRSVGSRLPPLVKYTIRMPISNTMRTDRLRDVMWTPGPHISASQYQINSHGFIYLQEDIEKAIIELQTEKVIDGPAVQIQAFPYPCYTRNNFLYSMSYSFPLIVMLAWVLFIAAFVKKLVQERELRLHEYMKMMGVSPFSHFFAWFIESATFLLITIIFLVIILKVGLILPQSNGFFVFLFFCDYGLSILSMSFLFSTFFSHTNIASLSGSLIYVILFFPFIVMTSLESSLTFTTKSLLGLFAPTCFSYASQYIIYYEAQGTGMQWDNSYQSPVINDNASFGWFCWLLLIDSAIYFIIGCYIRMVFPGKYGIAAPWYFPVLPSFWISCLPCFKPGSNGRSGLLFTNVMMHSQMADPKSKDTDNVFFEGEEDLDGLTVGVSLHGLTKMYGKSAALQNLNLRFYEDQVTSLLGHNGAGKTTTMSLLTGLFGPTSGTVLIYGKDTRLQMDAVRQSLGVCMQYDVLFDHLTAKEHLFLYAQIKAPDWGKEEVRHQVHKILKDTAMYTHRHKRVGALSGGTKRKLSIAIAFIGGSKTVVLDEPTTGVDPCSRRSIWDIVNMYKKERTIILSTHHLDEAEVLSDRIAFLERGGLKCCGSLLYLKQKLGTGYKLSLSKKIPEPGSEDQCDVNRVTEFIKSHFREAELKETVGSDMVYSLPTFGVQYAPYYQALLRGLDENLENLQLGSYGISDTTLEEVFLQLTKDEAEDNMSWSNTQMVAPVPFVNQVVEERSVSNYNISETEALKGNSSVTGISLFGQKILAVLVKRLQHSIRDWKGLFAQLLLPVLFVIAAMGLATIKSGVQTYPALELMPSMYGTTKQTTFFGIQNSSAYPLVSTMMSFPGIDNFCLENPGSKSCLSSSSLESWPSSGEPPSVFTLCSCNPNSTTCPNNSYQPAQNQTFSSQMLYNLSDVSIEPYLLTTANQFVQDRYGGWSFGQPLPPNLKMDINNVPSSRTLTKIWYNPEGYHSMPAYLNSLNNFILRTNLPSGLNASQYGISVFSQPYPGKVQADVATTQNTVNTLVALCVLTGYSIMTASFVIYEVKEQQTGCMLLQNISGIGEMFYWLINFFYDMTLYLIPVALSIAMIAAFQLPAFTNQQNLGAVSVLLILFGYATFPWMYLLVNIFKDAEMAYIVYVCINLFISINTIISTAIVYFLSLASSSDVTSVTNVYNKLTYTFMIFPQFSFGNGLMQLSRLQLQEDALSIYGVDSYTEPFSTDGIGWMLLSLAIQGTFFITLRLLINSWVIRKIRLLLCRTRPITQSFQEDIDVNYERRRVENEDSNNDMLRLANLTKLYKNVNKNVLAVNNICLGVPAGECFGLLGVNGAGKSTTFKMLTSEVLPTYGKAQIRNYNGALVDIKGSNFGGIPVGYCPQVDALDDLLTAEEHLYFYARIRGIHRRHIRRVVNYLLQKMELMNQKNKLSKHYSCGMKRKLSTAIALIGCPQILLLDEPSSGMDPKSKRHLWKIILDEVKEKCAVILTSHSMEECEALCSRLAIMVKGSFRCLGTLQHIKDRFGKGFTIRMHLMSSTSNVDNITSFMESKFPSTYLKDHHLGMVEYHIQVAPGGVADIFQELESNKEQLNIRYFSVCQTTLEEVFINFARDDSNSESSQSNSSGSSPDMLM